MPRATAPLHLRTVPPPHRTAARHHAVAHLSSATPRRRTATSRAAAPPRRGPPHRTVAQGRAKRNTRYLYKIDDIHNSSAFTCTRLTIYITPKDNFWRFNSKIAHFKQISRQFCAISKRKVMPIAILVHPKQKRYFLPRIARRNL